MGQGPATPHKRQKQKLGNDTDSPCAEVTATVACTVRNSELAASGAGSDELVASETGDKRAGCRLRAASRTAAAIIDCMKG